MTIWNNKQHASLVNEMRELNAVDGIVAEYTWLAAIHMLIPVYDSILVLPMWAHAKTSREESQ